jgi:hypothetical protein
MAPKRGFAKLSPDERKAMALKGVTALRVKGLNYQWSHQEAKEAGALGGHATWKKWKISRNGKELRVPCL